MIKAKKLCLLGTVLIIILNYSTYKPNTIKSVYAQIEKPTLKQNYIIKSKSKSSLSKIIGNYSSDIKYSDFLKKNKMSSLKLSSDDVSILSKDKEILYVEKDTIVEASSSTKGIYLDNKKKHKKRVKVNQKNVSTNEWNIRMINADKTKRNKKLKKRVKIAVLDSGVDWGNDISLAYSISLVPGEEEMTKIFMDGSGHGSSVASLIAADDDGKGITGINPNAEIYSIRVLDDENKAPLSRVIEGIYLAIEQKVNIINMSFGIQTYSKALKEAVKAAYDAGILVVAAAGNTGNSGVQFPAAYDEVLAVGSVDKKGEIVKNSARGDEVDIVAPGELVRTTGFLGTDFISSGTSLASPQVAAFASLIWEKDLSVSVDFVRNLIKESSNLYGKSDSYGNGLIDVKYALENYDKYKKRYRRKNINNKEERLLPSNKNRIQIFEDTGCVEGCWYDSDHNLMISDQKYYNLRAGARFPDKKGVYKETFAGITNNPWWHGYYTTNYVKAFIYATRMADAINTYGKGKENKANSLGYSDASKMLNDVRDIKWELEIPKKPDGTKQSDTKGVRRAFIWGMAIHSVTDIFAHSVFVNGKRIKHTENTRGKVDADDWQVVSERYYDARTVAQQCMDAYIDKKSPYSNLSLYTNLLYVNSGATTYKIKYIKEYVEQSAGSSASKKFARYSYNGSAQ